MEIKKNLTTVNYNKGGGTGRIKYIVIHYTANNGDTAHGNTNYFKSVNRNASAHYFVDEKEIWQCVEDKDIAWHCGTSGAYYHKYCRNNNSIGVELCSRKDKKGGYYFLDKTVDNALWLVKQLMKKYNVPIENVIRHYDVTHKNCPSPFVENVKAWQSFKAMLTEGARNKEENEEMVTKTDIQVNGTKYSVDRIFKDGKNYICLSDLRGKGFDVGYEAATKTPRLDNTVKDIDVEVDGQVKTVKAVNIDGYNFCMLRDIAEITGIMDIEYKERPVIITRR